MRKFRFNSINLDGEAFEIINQSVRLRLATRNEAFTYTRQPIGGFVKIKDNEFKAIEASLSSNPKSYFKLALVNTNGPEANFINSENVASFTGRITSKSRLGRNLSTKSLKKQLQKGFNKLSIRPDYSADQISTRTFLLNVTTTPSNQITFGGTATGEITLTGPTAGVSTFSRESLSQTTAVNLSTYDIVLETTSNNFNAATYGGAIEVTGSSTADTISTGSANDTLTGGDGDDTLSGGNGSDYIFGGTGNDAIDGSGGNDYIYGDLGNDSINGGAGDDTLTGGAGTDILTGGNGADQFNYTSINTLAAQTGITIETADLITDFNATRDYIYTGTAGTALNYFGAVAVADFATALIQANAVFNADNTYLYHLTSITGGVGLLFVNTNGDAVAEAVIQLTGVTSANFAFGHITADAW